MKKLSLIISLLFISSICFIGCGKEEVEEVQTTEVIEDIDVSVDNSVEQTITHEKTEAGQIFDEQVAELNEYYYYYSNIDSFSIKGKKAYTEEAINEQFILNSILKQFSDKVCLVENFEQISPDEIISYENGVPSVSYEGESIGYLSLDGTFQEILKEQNTALSEWFIIQTVADAFCKNFGCEKIQITSAGNTLTTLYKNYTLEDYVEFSTKIYDNFDIISEEEASFSRDVEKFILMGYDISRQNYVDILNGNFSIENTVYQEPVEEETSEEIDNIEEDIIDETSSVEVIENTEVEESTSEIEIIE